MTMSTELVPLDSYRPAWNGLHRAELAASCELPSDVRDLEAHTSLLTAEQAAQINEQYKIEIVVGVHGIPGDIRTESTQLEYDEVAAVVARLKPGDVLLVERWGFKQQPISLTAAGQVHGLDVSPVDFLSPRSLMSGWGDFYRDTKRQGLEARRRACSISAWQYARELADLKGIQVVYADQDAFEAEAFTALTGKKDLIELVGAPDEESQRLLEEFGLRQRAVKARNTVKDYALEHPRPAAVSLEEHDKPTLALLFGSSHEESLVQAFSEMQLPVVVTRLRESSTHERLIEGLGRPALGRLTLALLLLLDPGGIAPAPVEDRSPCHVPILCTNVGVDSLRDMLLNKPDTASRDNL